MNDTSEISLDEAGRIFIPAPLRERLSLSPGMTLVVEQGERGGVRLRIQRETPILVEKDGVLVARVEALDDLTGITRRVRDQRVLTLLQQTGL